jgi:hypothetical protein
VRKNLCCIMLILLLGGCLLGALSSEDLLFRIGLRTWGVDGALGWKGLRVFPGVDTVFWVSAGVGFQSENYFAGANDAVMPADPGTVRYDNLNFDWRLGVAQGILFNREQKRNLLELVLLYRGKYHCYLDPNGALAGLPDQNGLLQNSLLTGLVYDDVLADLAYATRRGVYAAAAAEFTPQVLANSVLGAGDYTRLSLMACGYLPVLITRALSIYLADQLLYDHLFGDEAWIPQSVRASFGALTSVPIGRNPLRALGGTLRGIAKDRFDGYIKLANNAEVRLHLPALTMFNLVTPGLIFYFDAGAYDHLSRQLRFNPLYCCTGIGLALYGLGYDFVLYGSYFINENRFSPVLELSAHF